MRDATEIALELLKRPTERDKQVKVGASNFSSLCTKCLAEELLATKDEGESFAWAGAVVGTAIHNLLDSRVQEMHPEWHPEQRLILGDLPGYGTVKSTLDLYIPEDRHLIDYKTTTKAKLPFIQDALKTEGNPYEISSIAEARYKVSGYLNQLMSYGRGLTLAGHVVEYVSLVFICRDAVGDRDVWSHTVPYDPEQAEAVWNRLQALWEWLQGGGNPEELDSHKQCYYCVNLRGG